MAFKTERWTLANILPVSFVVWLISTLWFIYLDTHLWDLLQLGKEHHERDLDMWRRGRWQALVSQTLTVLLVTCLLRAMFTDPGSVPEGPSWRKSSRPTFSGGGSQEFLERVHQFEVKADGHRRFCKWCDHFKPDRCHHCRVCKSCILRMDHHCPWIANCVGFHNHKYFFLLVLYALLNVAFIVITMSESMDRAINQECTPKKRFAIIFGMTLASLMGLLLMMFFAFHVSLMLNATTTIEYCEKQAKQGSDRVSYDVGSLGNIQQVLGPYMLLWLLPVSPPVGDGMTFVLKDAAAGGRDALLPDKVAAKSVADTEPANCGDRAVGQDSCAAAGAPEVTSSKHALD